MKAADVRRVIEHAIPSEIGLACDYAQTGEKYQVSVTKRETFGDAILDEAILSHAFTGEFLNEIEDARKASQGEAVPRLFWHTAPQFVPATPQAPAAIRARYIITNLPKRYETAAEVTAALETGELRTK